MTDTATAELRKTPLDARHRALHARMVPFAGWEMPVEYSGITREHMAVRTSAALFDVSHMGEIEVAGKDAVAAVQRVACNDASQLRVGQAHYSGLLTPEGTFLDDMVVYRMGPAHFLLVVNASTIAKDYAWIREQVKSVSDAAVIDSSSRYALVAVQGPASRDVLQPLTGVELATIDPFCFAYGEVAGARATISRTGYTGEDGFEISFLRTRPVECGTHSWILAVSRTSSPRALEPATRFASRRRCGSMATTSMSRRRRWKRGSVG